MTRLILLAALTTGCIRGVLPENAPPGACHRERVGFLTWQNVCSLQAWSHK